MQSVGSVGQSPFTWTNLLFYSLSCRHTMNNISKHVKKTLDMYNINIVPCLLWLQDNVSGYLLRHLCISLRAGLLICQRLRNNHMDDLASLAICTLWYINLTFSAFQGIFYEIHSCVFCSKEQTLPRNAIHIRLRDKVFLSGWFFSSRTRLPQLLCCSVLCGREWHKDSARLIWQF